MQELSIKIESQIGLLWLNLDLGDQFKYCQSVSNEWSMPQEQESFKSGVPISYCGGFLSYYSKVSYLLPVGWARPDNSEKEDEQIWEKIRWKMVQGNIKILFHVRGRSFKALISCFWYKDSVCDKGSGSIQAHRSLSSHWYQRFLVP